MSSSLPKAAHIVRLALVLVLGVASGCLGGDDDWCETDLEVEIVAEGVSGGFALAGDTMYWSDHSGIHRQRLFDTESELIVDDPRDPTTVKPSWLVTVDGVLYWADQRDGRIRKLDPAVGEPVDVVTGIEGFRSPSELTVDAGHLYWLEPGDYTVAEMSLEGGDVHRWRSVEEGFGPPMGLHVRPEALFWSQEDALWRLDRETEEIAEVFPLSALTVGLHVDSEHVYWVARESGRPDSNALHRADRDGANRVKLFDLGEVGSFFADAGDYVYFVNTRTTIDRFAKQGGPLERVITCGSDLKNTRVIDGWLYWVEGPSIDEVSGLHYRYAKRTRL